MQLLSHASPPMSPGVTSDQSGSAGDVGGLYSPSPYIDNEYGKRVQ